MLRQILVGLMAGVAFLLLDGVLNANPMAQRLYAAYQPIARQSVNALAGSAINLAFGVLLAALFSTLRTSLPGRTKVAKALSFGLIVWFLRVCMRVAGAPDTGDDESLNSGGVVDRIRRVLGALFTALGAYYCGLGIVTLAQLPAVTRQWIERSGDPDFKYDYGLFMMLSAFGATSITALGWRTVVKGLATARGRQVSWLGPAVAALPLHWFWFLYRKIGASVLDDQGQSSLNATPRSSSVSCARAICCCGSSIVGRVRLTSACSRRRPAAPLAAAAEASR